MRRYLVYGFDFDSRAMMMDPPGAGWDEQARVLHHHNTQRLAVALAAEFGLVDAERKRDDFVAFGRRPFCMIGLYSSIMQEMQRTFVSGNYYASLTTACTLGELIFNLLLERLWPYYNGGDPLPRRVQNWDRAVAQLKAWEVVDDRLVGQFAELKQLRNLAVHFVGYDPANLRERALQANNLTIDIATTLFGVDGGRPWMLKGTPGAMFVAKQAQNDPFVQEFVLPNAYLVGPFHRLSPGNGGMQLIDHPEYEGGEISDEEFARMYVERSDADMPPEPAHSA